MNHFQRSQRVRDNLDGYPVHSHYAETFEKYTCLPAGSGGNP